MTTLDHAGRTPGTAELDQDEVLESIARSMRETFLSAEHRAASFIREAIVEGAFAPGERLNLNVIATTLGISRMPVRASLSDLEREGLVQVSAYRGATVTVLTPELVDEIYQMRILLETYLLERVIDRLDDELLDRVQAAMVGLDRPGAGGSRLDRYNQCYELLYERADRPRAVAQVSTLRTSVGQYLLRRVAEESCHLEFLGHLRAGDLDGAQEWVRSHLRRVSESLQETVLDEAVFVGSRRGA